MVLPPPPYELCQQYTLWLDSCYQANAVFDHAVSPDTSDLRTRQDVLAGIQVSC